MAEFFNSTDLVQEMVTKRVPINSTLFRTVTPKATRTEQVTTTTTNLNKLSFNFFDTQDFQDRISDLLAGREAESREPTVGPTTTTVRDEDGPGPAGGLNMGILIPVAVFVLFLLTVSICFVWQALHERWRVRHKRSTVPTSFYRSYSGWDDYRASVRSTTTLKLPPPSYSQREFTPKLDRISESPEDQLKNCESNPEKIFSPTSSLASILSRLHFELPSISRDVEYQYPPPGYVTELSQSYPNLRVAPQAPFSPYHIAWMTPTVTRPVQSEPNIRHTTDLGRVMSHSGPYQPSTPSELSIPMNQTTWKSPYHPNYNTPTNGSDNDSGALPPHAVLNYAPEYNNNVSSSFNSSDPILVPVSEAGHPHRVHHLSNPDPKRPRGQHRSTGEDGGVRKGPQSGLASWQYNQLYVQPGNQSLPLPLLYPPDKAALEHAAYGSCSMCAFMGSTDNSGLHTHSGSVTIPELPDLIGTTSLPPYTQMDQHFLRLYDPTIAVAPPYEYTAAPPYDSNNNTTYVTSTSTNTSMCAHRDIDSMETSVSTSTLTTGPSSSRDTSGSTATGPSHSTSLTGMSTSRAGTDGPCRHASGTSATYLSSLTPVLPPGYPTTTPESSILTDSTTTTNHANNTSNETDDSIKAKVIPDENNNSNALMADSKSMTATTSKMMADGGGDPGGLTFTRSDTSSSSQDQSSCRTTPAQRSYQTSTTSGSASFQWDSMATSASPGDIDGRGSQESVAKEMASSPRSRNVTPGSARSGKGHGYEWDGYPFYTPGEPRSRAGSEDSGGGPIPRLINAHPVLANAQYWV